VEEAIMQAKVMAGEHMLRVEDKDEVEVVVVDVDGEQAVAVEATSHAMLEKFLLVVSQNVTQTLILFSSSFKVLARSKISS